MATKKKKTVLKVKGVTKTPYVNKGLRELLVDQNGGEALLFADGFDDCIIGLCDRFDMEPIVAYDRAKIISSLMSDGMTAADAEEYFEFNIQGAYVGELTPCFITLVSDIRGV